MEETNVSQEIPIIQSEEDAGGDVNMPNKDINGVLHVGLEGNKEEEETNLDGEFIKIDKESFDSKESHASGNESVENTNNPPSVVEQSQLISGSNEDLLEAQDKIIELNLDLKRSHSELKNFADENACLNNDLSLLQEKLDEAVDSFKSMKDDNVKLLQDLHVLEAKEAEFLILKEEYRSVSTDLEESKKKTEELEQKLELSLSGARKFEDLHIETSSHVEAETQRATELENSLQSEKVRTGNLENEVHSMQQKLEVLDQKLAENEALESDLREKNAELEATKLKLNEELSSRERAETELRNYEAQVSQLVEQIKEERETKESLNAEVADVSRKLAGVKELNILLEEKLKLSYEKFHTADSLLSEANSNKEDLENKLEALETLRNESLTTAEIYYQKNAELESAIHASESQTEEVRSQAREVEQKNTQLEQQLNEVQLKFNNTEVELGELSKKLLKLDGSLKLSEEEKQHLEEQIHAYEEKVSQIESQLSEELSRNSKLEEELSIVKEESARAIELEGLLQTSNAKVDVFEMKSIELETLLEEHLSKILYLEEIIATKEVNLKNKEEESQLLSSKVSEIQTEFDQLRSKAESLEHVEHELHLVYEKQRNLTEQVALTSKAKTIFEEESNELKNKLKDAEDQLEGLQHELKVSHESLENSESSIRITEEKLEQKERLLEETKARNSELESSTVELQLNLRTRNTEFDSLLHETELLREQIKYSEQKIADESDKNLSFAQELEQSMQKVQSLERLNVDLQKEISAVEDRAARCSSENEMLLGTNIDLQNKLSDLQQSAESAISEKGNLTCELTSHANTIAELSEQHACVSELHSASEARALELDKKLQDAIDDLSQKDMLVLELKEKIGFIETQVSSYEEQAHESVKTSESCRIELEETLARLKGTEAVVGKTQAESEKFETECVNLAEANTSLSHDLSLLQSEASDLRVKLSAALSGNEEINSQLCSSKAAIDDLANKLTSEREELNNQISLVAEENKLLKQMYEKSKTEVQNITAQLDSQIKEHKEVEDALDCLKNEVVDKSTLEVRVKELENAVVIEQSRLNQEVEKLKSTAIAREDELQEQVEKLHNDLDLAKSMKAEHETFAKNYLQEVEAKTNQISLLEEQVSELLKKSVLADEMLKEKDDQTEAKYRDIGIKGSTSSKRKSKKKAEPIPENSSPATVDVSSAFTLRFMFGIALVSAFVGLFIGKKY